AMAVAVWLDRARLGDARLLAQSGKRIILAEDRDHRAAFARFADHRSRNIGDVAGNAEAFALELLDVLGNRAMLDILQLRHAPDAVAQRLEWLLLGVDEAPDLLGIVHDVLSHARALPLPCHAGGGFATRRVCD